jgi:hypothetical protein
VKTVKIKRGKGFTNVLQFDTCDVKNKHITKDLHHSHLVTVAWEKAEASNKYDR